MTPALRATTFDAKRVGGSPTRRSFLDLSVSIACVTTSRQLHEGADTAFAGAMSSAFSALTNVCMAWIAEATAAVSLLSPAGTGVGDKAAELLGGGGVTRGDSAVALGAGDVDSPEVPPAVVAIADGVSGGSVAGPGTGLLQAATVIVRRAAAPHLRMCIGGA